jgi:hypothetical protein
LLPALKIPAGDAIEPQIDLAVVGVDALDPVLVRSVAGLGRYARQRCKKAHPRKAFGADLAISTTDRRTKAHHATDSHTETTGKKVAKNLLGLQTRTGGVCCHFVLVAERPRVMGESD